MPMPPFCAMAMAMRASVTVSMLALTMGTLSGIDAVNRVAVLTSPREANGDRLGTSSTSSKVRPF